MRHSINGLPINVLESGSGPLTLVFLHYFGGSALEWGAVTNILSNQYHCLAIDLRGYGDSIPTDSFPSKTGFSVADMADDVACVIERFIPGDYILVGHSMSGKVALTLAARQPANMQSLVLVSPSPPVPEPIADDERHKLITGYGNRASAEQTLKNITAVHVPSSVCDQIIADDLRTAKPAWMAWLKEGSLEDISSRMPFVDVPVHILVGSEDRALPPDVQSRMVLPYLKNVTVEIAEGAGHLLPWEIPNELAAFILKKISI
jgi:pimeloyl-ACP methyl ester carboxylesterase